jgi:hypothetical protein
MSESVSRPERAPIWPGDRVRVVGAAGYLWGELGTVICRSEQSDGRLPSWVVQLDRSQGVGVPDGFPAGRPYVFRGDSLERIPDGCACHGCRTGNGCIGEGSPFWSESL